MRRQPGRLRKAPRKAIDFTLALALIVLTCVPVLSGATPAKRADAASDPIHLNVGGSIYYAGYETHWMDVDGAMAYCAQPQMQTPPSGTYERSPLRTVPSGVTQASVEQMAAGIYYGFGGPGFDESKRYFPAAWFDGTPMNDERYAALTHIVVSDIYSCTGSLALQGTSDEFREWASYNVIGYSADDGRSLNPNATRRVLADVGNELPAPPASFVETCFTLRTGNGNQDIVGYVPQGKISVQKSSANAGISACNGAYSLSGAVYGIYSDQACANQVATMTTDDAGYAQSEYLALGTYYVKELTASYGFALDEKVQGATVYSSKTTPLESKEMPNYSRADLLIQKVNKETGNPATVGAAEFEGAEFSVSFTPKDATASTKTWLLSSDATGEVHFGKSHKAGGDDFFVDDTGTPVLPIGHYTVRETKAPVGYLAMEGELSFDIADASNTDTDPVLTFDQVQQAAQQVQRGDFQFRKVDDRQSPLAGIPFMLSYDNGEDGQADESHVIVTDENGRFNSSSASNSHLYKTNANDDAVNVDGQGNYTVDESKLDPHAGTWFSKDKTGESAPAGDAKGALPYGSYQLVELPCSANAKKNLVSLTFTVYRDQIMVELNNIVDTEPAIGTTASDKADGDDSLDPAPDAALIDAVDYRNLTPGTEYTLHGTLMLKETGAPVTNDKGEAITVEKTFTPDHESGNVKAEFGFNASELAGKTVVVFEDLLEDGKTVATHSDLDSTSQSVHVGPAIHTMAIDKADDDKSVSGPEATVLDTVKYLGLAPKSSYTMKGILMDKTTGQAVTGVDGSEVTASTQFTTEEKEGEVAVELPVDASGLVGHDLVVFEKCLDEQGNTVALHEDFNDQGQTVTVVDETQSETPGDSTEQGGYDKTGSSFLPLAFFAGMLAIVGACLVGITAHRRRAEAEDQFDFGRR